MHTPILDHHLAKNIKYVHNGELDPYISTLKKIIGLRIKLSGNDELKNLIRLEIKNHDNK